jgi:hypothetical protein
MLSIITIMPLYCLTVLTDRKTVDKLKSYTRVNIKVSDMQNKQKVTLYIPPELHRKLKIRAAIDIESMSSLVEKALDFYIQHPEKVEQVEASVKGKTHQVHICPECNAAMVLREGQMVSIKNQPSLLEDELPLDVRGVDTPEKSQGEELVPC